MTEMTIIVPTRNRPQNVAPIIKAWRETGAFEEGARLHFVVDADDPLFADYRAAVPLEGPASMETAPFWQPLVPKLNRVARFMAAADCPLIGFAGDDHLPRTFGWVSKYRMALDAMGVGVASCPDGYRSDDLPTQWVMTADIIRTLGAMVPAPVDHLYCDNAVRDVASLAGCYYHIPDMLIEHMHPVAGKAEDDEGYRNVNSDERYRSDYQKYTQWRFAKLRSQAALIRDLREAHRGE